MTSPIPHTPPTFKENGFNCPFCHAYAEQKWNRPILMSGNTHRGISDTYWMCSCTRCHKWSFWVDKKLAYPIATTAPSPNPDIPDDIRRDYEEARCILFQSPRGAAALLRLCIQKLCKHLGQPGNNINEDIGTLVKNGLPLKVQQSLDIVRVAGNDAVHAGQLDLRDNFDTATKLFGLVNLIADFMITQPKHVEEMYNAVVPESKKVAIEKRDGK